MNDRIKTRWVKNRTGSVMNAVTLAMVPGVLAMAAQYGPGVIWNVFWLTLLCCAVEVVCTSMRYGGSPARQRQFDLGDGTTVLAAVIISICLPPFVSPAILAVAAVAAIALAKHAYGGLGQNIFNPAMVGYGVILLSFPLALASWPADPDGLTGATLLSEFRYRGNITATEFAAGQVGGNPNLITAGLFALGGAWLIHQGIMHWRIPLTVLLTVGLLALIFHDGGSSASLGSPWFHWTTGGTVAAAFFVATDPVTHPARPQHQVVFAMLIGCLLFLIRTQGNLPDGIAFAVLLANCTTPLFNRIHRQRLAAGDSERA
jgi:electron transport complex protein RnfD